MQLLFDNDLKIVIFSDIFSQRFIQVKFIVSEIGEHFEIFRNKFEAGTYIDLYPVGKKNEKF
jgi:hypothetical protein